jgi:hypothetical protein
MRVQPGWHKRLQSSLDLTERGRIPFRRVESKLDVARAEFYHKVVFITLSDTQFHLFEIDAPSLGKGSVKEYVHVCN